MPAAPYSTHGTMFMMYHWSPTERRNQINRRGFVPGSWSVDRVWRPPVICFSDNPSLAWALSGQIHTEVPIWDLWAVWSDVPTGYEEIWDHYPDTGRPYIKEYRVYERIFKRDIWYVATREVKGAKMTSQPVEPPRRPDPPSPPPTPPPNPQ
jgi:hypothetical protein